MAIKAVLFDLGDTLLTYGAVDVNELLRQAARLTYSYLRECTGSPEKLGGFPGYYRHHVFSIKLRYFWSNISNRDFNAQDLLEGYLRRMGVTVGAEQLEELCWLWYQPLSEKATIEPKLHQHLQALREMSLKLSIVSNTFSPPAVLDRHLRQLDLLKFFEVRQYSSTMVYRKPDPRIFQEVLRRLELEPQEAVMVGDKIREDIKGAQKTGIRAILKRSVANRTQRVSDHIPTIKTIAELPELIRNWPGSKES